jgi:hypothetical protein
MEERNEETRSTSARNDFRNAMIGRFALWDVRSPDGRLIARAGEQITHTIVSEAESYGAFNDLYRATGGSDEPAMRRDDVRHELIGRRAAFDVVSDDGTKIVEAGQQITHTIVEQAEDSRSLDRLTAAAGFSEPKRSASPVASAVNTGAEVARDIVGGFVSRMRDGANKAIAFGEQKLEDRAIRYALGRRVDRAIIDDRDNVVLAEGGLITHRAIERAREAGVLDMLLTSVAAPGVRTQDREKTDSTLEFDGEDELHA